MQSIAAQTGVERGAIQFECENMLKIFCNSDYCVFNIYV